MEYNTPKDISTLSTSDVENSVENVETVENSKCCVENSMIKIPFIVHEAEIAILERHIKRLWIALIIAVVSIVLCNVSWLIYILRYPNQWTYNGGFFPPMQCGCGCNA